MEGTRYLLLDDLVLLIHEPQQTPVRQLVADHRQLFETVQGSANKHQAWPGGYVDHVCEVMNLAVQLDTVMRQLRPLPYSLSDALLVLFLHDSEKPWKYRLTAAGQAEIIPELADKSAQHKFRAAKLAEYGITLTEPQLNAMQYVEGEMGDYSPERRVMNELAAFCHMCDVASARVWHAYPAAADDPWPGAKRVRATTS